MTVGWRARIGLIYAADGVLDHEFAECAPSGVSVHITRTPVPDITDYVTRSQTTATSNEIDKAASLFRAIQPQCIGYAVTSASFIYGRIGNEKLIGRIEAAGGVPATTASYALVQAMIALGVAQPALITPYPYDIVECLCSFLKEYSIKAIAVAAPSEIPDGGIMEAADVYQLTKKLDARSSDSLLIACTNVATSTIVEALEQDIGKPVVSANLALMWHSLRLAGVHEHHSGFGQLFRLPGFQSELDSKETI